MSYLGVNTILKMNGRDTNRKALAERWKFKKISHFHLFHL